MGNNQTLASASDTKVLLLGSRNAGKSHVMTRLKYEENIRVLPTVGFTVELIQYKKVNFTMWDVSGEPLAAWKLFFKGTNAVIYVIDANDRNRFPESLDELRRTLIDEELKDVVLLILLNKQDLPGSFQVSEVEADIKALSLTQKRVLVLGSTATTGEGLREGIRWIALQLFPELMKQEKLDSTIGRFSTPKEVDNVTGNVNVNTLADLNAKASVVSFNAAADASVNLLPSSAASASSAASTSSATSSTSTSSSSSSSVSNSSFAGNNVSNNNASATEESLKMNALLKDNENLLRRISEYQQMIWSLEDKVKVYEKKYKESEAKSNHFRIEFEKKLNEIKAELMMKNKLLEDVSNNNKLQKASSTTATVAAATSVPLPNNSANINNATIASVNTVSSSSSTLSEATISTMTSPGTLPLITPKVSSNISSLTTTATNSLQPPPLPSQSVSSLSGKPTGETDSGIIIRNNNNIMKH